MFLGTVLRRYLLPILLVVGNVAIIWALWQLHKNSSAEAARLAFKLEQVQVSAELSAERLEALSVSITQIQTRAELATQELKELRRNNEEVATFLSTPIPHELDSLLRNRRK